MLMYTLFSSDFDEVDIHQAFILPILLIRLLSSSINLLRSPFLWPFACGPSTLSGPFVDTQPDLTSVVPDFQLAFS